MAARGVTLAEYVLIGALVLIVCIGGLTLLGNATKNLWGGFDSALASGKAGISGGGSGSGGGGGNPTSPSSPANGTNFGSNPTSPLNTIAPPDGPIDVKTSITTSGANGTTQILASQIQQFAQQMKDQGLISEADQQSLAELANQGYEIAKIQAMIEGAAKNATDVTQYVANEVTYNGKTMAPQDLNLMLCASATSCSFSAPGGGSITTTGYDKPAVVTFKEIKAKLEANGALNNPNVKAVVNKLSNEILDVAQAANESSNMITIGGASPQDLIQMQASRVTNTNSTAICITGGDTSNGSTCY